MSQTATTLQSTTGVNHFHHWAIEEPHGPVSTGVCRICGMTKEFKNWLADADFTTNEERSLQVYLARPEPGLPRR